MRTPTTVHEVHEGPPITVLSANLWHDWPKHRRLFERLESFAELVKSERADIVLLQEVSRTPSLHVDAWLARQLGMASIYSRANGHETAIGFEEGLAIFSRFPLVELHLRQLGMRSNPFVRRLALGAEIDTPFGNLLAFSVHLGLRRRHNAAQLSDLRTWVAGITGSLPALIGGDFNAHERSPQIVHTQRTWLDTFRHLHPEKDGTTHELRWPWGSLLR
ncbi:MAG: endonuclease/exonuclease/phosphatase family protein, partial [Chloroflexota bacterium]